MTENQTDVCADPGDRTGSQAVVDEHLMACACETGRDGEQPQRGHPVGRGGDVLQAGDPVRPGGVDQNDAHGESCLP